MTHEQIWAPWRICYIQGTHEKPPAQAPHPSLLPGADPQCFLCVDVADTAGRQQGVVWRGDRTITVLNRYPYNNGHLLVAPQRHLGRLDGLTPDEQLELSQTLTRMVGLLEKTIQPQGFNIGLNLGRTAGAGLPGHLHWHIVPRWVGDTNFMPVLGNTHVIPQSLDALWEVLTAELGKEQQG